MRDEKDGKREETPSPAKEAAPKRRPTHLPPVETRFKKGQSGNPSGLPKGYISYGVRLRNRALKIIRDAGGLEVCEGDALVAKLHKLAIVDGDVKAAKLIMQHADGVKEQVAGQVNFEQVRNVTIQIVGDAEARAATQDFLQRITYDAGRIQDAAYSTPHAVGSSGGNGNGSANGNGHHAPPSAETGGNGSGPNGAVDHGGGAPVPGGAGGPSNGSAMAALPTPPGHLGSPGAGSNGGDQAPPDQRPPS